jgi:hypothetical protein
MSKNKSIKVYFPNSKTDNPDWEYEDVTGHFPLVSITKDAFIKTNNLGKAHNFSQRQDAVSSGRAAGIKRKRKTRRTHRKRTNTRKRR